MRNIATHMTLQSSAKSTMSLLCTTLLVTYVILPYPWRSSPSNLDQADLTGEVEKLRIYPATAASAFPDVQELPSRSELERLSQEVLVGTSAAKTHVRLRSSPPCKLITALCVSFFSLILIILQDLQRELQSLQKVGVSVAIPDPNALLLARTQVCF